MLRDKHPEYIAVFLPSFAGGGAERMMINLACEFAERGLRVDLVAAEAKGPYLRLVPENVHLVDLKAPRVLAALPGLTRYLRRRRPDVLLSAMFHANIIALWAGELARTGCRVAVSVRNTLSASAPASPKAADRIMPLLTRLFYPRAGAVIAVSGGVADDLAVTAGLDRCRIAVVHNPAVTPELLRAARRPTGHPWFGTDRPPVILAAGRLTAQKDYPALLRAFDRVRRRRPARLLILGEGELRQDLEAMGLNEEAAMPGFVQNPFAFMSRASVFVLSSRWEGLPGALIEAMACGAPVVSTDCPSGPAEILEGGRWGRLTPVGDDKALARAIIRTLEEPQHPDVRRRAAEFGPERAADGYLKAIRGW